MKVIVFGATGVIGTGLVQILTRDHPEWQIVGVTSSADLGASRLAKLGLRNVEIKTGNIDDRTSVETLCQDCSIIFSCIGFHQYERRYWAEHWPVVVDNLLAATGGDKKLVFCDNLYAYGNPQPEALSTASPRVEAGLKSKPAVRSLLHDRFEAHMKAHPGTVAVIASSDFFGPYITDKSFLGDGMMGKIVRGEKPMAMGSCDVVHDFCFAQDFSAAMAVAATNDKAFDHFWIAPHAVKNKTVAEVAADAAALAKQPPKRPMVMGRFVISLLSPFVGFMGEIKEMLHIWTADYRVDDSEFINEFGLKATPYKDALTATVDFFQSQAEANKK